MLAVAMRGHRQLVRVGNGSVYMETGMSSLTLPEMDTCDEIIGEVL
jgi:hypothetical protein